MNYIKPKILIGFFLFSILLSITKAGSNYNEPILVNELYFEVQVTDDNKVELRWNKYIPKNFNYYKVIRSQTNPNPVYPDDGYIKYSSDPNYTYYLDTKPPEGKVYYRVCSIAKPDRYCSETLSVDIDKNEKKGDENINEQTEKKEEEKNNEQTDKKTDFYDIETNIYKTAIKYLLNKKIVQGYTEDKTDIKVFKPDQKISRAEFIKILVESIYKEEFYPSSNYSLGCFSDIEKNAWYENYICFAKSRGIIDGYNDGTFGPQDSINFVEAAKILVNVYGLDKEDIEGEWYTSYVKSLQKNSFIAETITSLNKNINRGEMAEMIWRIQENITNKESKELIHDSIANKDYEGWKNFDSNEYSFYYPSNWYHGIKRGWDYLSEEKDYIDNLSTPYYMNVDTYLVTYFKNGSNTLRINNYFDHPEIEALEMQINGIQALRRKFRAPRGTIVNGRETGENEIILQYTYLTDDGVIVLQYFNASSNEDYGVTTFDKIGYSVKKK